MTMRYYSASTCGFYVDGIHKTEHLPKDAVEVSDSEWKALLDAQSAGKEIVPDTTGQPIAVERGSRP